MVKPPKILVTRPEPGATATTSALLDLGLDAVKFPFTEMVAMPDAKLALDVQDYDGVIITSANALRYADPQLLASLENAPLFAVGDATAAAARDHGFKTVYSSDGNAKDLCKTIELKHKVPCQFVYLCGVTRTDDVELQLASSGFKLRVIETYETKKVSQLTYKLQQLLSTNGFDAIVFYSSVSAQIFRNEFVHFNPAQLSDLNVIFCISDKARSHLPEAVKQLAIVCSAPRDDQMILEIKDYYSG